MRLLLLLVSVTLLSVSAFTLSPRHAAHSCFQRRASSFPPLTAAAIAVPIEQLEQNLTTAERSVTNVVRMCGSSVAFVISVLVTDTQTTTTTSIKRPPGRSLGAGSGFVVDSDGYIVTNYHVIERAYVLQQQKEQVQTVIQNMVGNATRLFLWGSDSNSNSNTTASLIQGTLFPSFNTLHAQVYVRMDQATDFIPCRIVNVKPELDVAVLKMLNTTTTDSLQSIPFGSSSSLLVGQSLVAIGNPFGLDTSVTSGVVSALNREVQLTSSFPNQVIRNCIQTDASINPGNSGGPLLNLNGQVIGVNTAIVTTSGSSAGVGFAIPSDEVEPVVSHMIRHDVGRRDKLAWLGVNIVQPTVSKMLQGNNWVATVEPNSPALAAGIQPLSFSSDNGTLVLGDAIVAIGGNDVPNFASLQNELQQRKVGEQVAVTLLNAQGEKRVVYLQLGTIPASTTT